MDFIEKAKKEIREEWFGKHIASIKGKEGLQVITWGKPGTSFYYTKFILSGNNVFISGDLGEAVYTLTCPATLDNIKDFHLEYFTGKLTAFCEPRWDFDIKLAQKELQEFWKEYRMDTRYKDGKEIKEGIVYVIEQSTSLESYRAWLMPVHQDTSIDSEDLECVWDFGKRMPRRLIGYWVGLQMAIKQLSKNENHTVAR